ncbi:gametocyte-specific factor 1-like [Colias croceus]|uniref:gametocyte-specific factor 1-like n=1 Tax=Colias crocea TaxID=72248 RepID=UPI001E27ACF0|nr:gametocyte-specific factor 1-like [Colias croceus]
MEDPFVACPYNKMHRIPRSRIQRHIVKCPDKRPDFGFCPYDATHIMPTKDILKHTDDCPSKFLIYPENKPPVVNSTIVAPKPILQREYLPETDPNHEIWDD